MKVQIRKNVVEAEYFRTIEMIRAEIGDGSIWISIDETTDAEGRYIANVIIGKLGIEAELNKRFLFHCVQLPATNAETIAKLFTVAVFILWPVDTPSKMDQVFLFVTDAAPYMVKADKNLKTLYIRLIHVTCAAHGLHRVCETIRSEFPLTNTIISTVKKVFLKSPHRLELLKNMYPNLPLPPAPVITRWGTWLLAEEYYSDYFVEIAEVLRALNNDSEAITTAKATIEDPALISKLTAIKSHYVHLAEIITKLESPKLQLAEGLELVKSAETKLSTTSNKKIKAKFRDVFQKNVGLQALTAISEGNTKERLKFDNFKGMSPAELALFKYTPIVSCDVERSLVFTSTFSRTDAEE